MPLFLLLALAALARAAAPVEVPAPAFHKVVVVVFENASWSQALAQPFFAQLAAGGASLTDYRGVAHPSQPNYIALIAGSTLGVKGDGNVDLDAPHLGDLLEARGKSWKVYAQGYPGSCFLGKRSGKYVRKHVPFLSFKNVQTDAQRCARVVDAGQFEADAAAGTLPDFSLYVPDLDADGHDTGVAAASRWALQAFGPKLKDPVFMKDLLFIATFDEDDYSSSNRIAALLYGPAVAPGSSSGASYTHYSLLRTLEEGFGLPGLGRQDASASPITGIWKAQ